MSATQLLEAGFVVLLHALDLLLELLIVELKFLDRACHLAHLLFDAAQPIDQFRVFRLTGLLRTLIARPAENAAEQASRGPRRILRPRTGARPEREDARRQEYRERP